MAGGDPYIFPIEGPVTKLPNCDAFYRLLQCDTCYVNVSVGYINVRQSLPDVDVVKECTIVSGGFFFTRLYILDMNGKEIVDLDLKQHRKTLSETGPLWIESSVQVSESSKGILQGCYHFRTLELPGGTGQLEVRSYNNPQIQNELFFYLNNKMVFDGLISRNYRSKLFQIPTIAYSKPLAIKTKRMLTHKGITNQGEVRDSVLHPRLFNHMFRS